MFKAQQKHPHPDSDGMKKCSGCPIRVIPSQLTKYGQMCPDLYLCATCTAVRKREDDKRYWEAMAGGVR